MVHVLVPSIPQLMDPIHATSADSANQAAALTVGADGAAAAVLLSSFLSYF